MYHNDKMKTLQVVFFWECVCVCGWVHGRGSGRGWGGGGGEVKGLELDVLPNVIQWGKIPMTLIWKLSRKRKITSDFYLYKGPLLSTLVFANPEYISSVQWAHIDRDKMYHYIILSHLVMSEAELQFYLFKSDLDRSTPHLKFDPIGVRTLDLQTMTVHFMSMIAEMLALTIRPSVTCCTELILRHYKLCFANCTNTR